MLRERVLQNGTLSPRGGQHMHRYMHTFIYVCVCVCVYIYTYPLPVCALLIQTFQAHQV
jgi:hypothetical protein